ncbi:MAG TPA: hypothetical protein VN806_09175 [Caulobacteraceae bacterium]|nr:hypothetical protein [Caulobacteraceae bacterium]
MERHAAKLGFYAASISFLAALGFGIVQLAEVVGLVRFPVADVLIYSFSLVIAAPFMLAIMALAFTAEGERRIWAAAALLLSVLYATYVTLVYAVQLASVIPAAIAGVAPHELTMYPHSMFWTLDGLGYVSMGAATALAAFALPREAVWTRRFLLANGWITPLIAFVYLYPQFSNGLLLLGAPWLVTAPGAILLLAGHFRRLHAPDTVVFRVLVID